MRKKLTKLMAVALALVMVAALVPAVALADNTYITTAAQLSTAFGSSNVTVEGTEAPFTVTIKGNVSYQGSEHIRIATQVNLVVESGAKLDMGSHILLADVSGDNKGELTISGEGTITSTGNKVVQAQNGASLTITGGTFTGVNNYGTVVALGTGTQLNITGGTIIGKNLPAVNIQDGASGTINGGKISKNAGSAEDRNPTVQVGIGTDETVSKVVIGGDADITGVVSVFGKGDLTITGNAKITNTSGFAVSTNGSASGENSSKNAKITIEGGTLTGGTSVCGVYLPAGKMTVTGGTISGGAGIVVRGGVLDVQGGTIEATGTGDITVGDAKKGADKYSVPAAGIAVDKNDSYNGGKNEVTVSGDNTVVTAAKGPAVSYSEQGVTDDKVPDGENNKIEVKGGTFQTGGEADKSVSSYTAGNILIGDDGKLSDELCVEAFGYGATKEEAIKGAMAATQKTKEDSWFSDWNDQTMWVAFNQKIPEGKFVIVTVKDPLGNEKIQMLCNGGSQYFAWSYLNNNQTPDTGIVSGSYSIKAEVYEGTYTEGAEEKSGAPVKCEEASLTVAAPATPDVSAAILGNGEEKQPTSNAVTATAAKSSAVGDYFEVHFTTDDLQKTGQNGTGEEKYYLGFAVVAPDKATKFQYRTGAAEAALLGSAWIQANELEKRVTVDGDEGVAYYVTVANGTVTNPWIQIRWQDTDGKTIRIDTYKIVIDEISYVVTGVTGFKFVDFGFKADAEDANKAINDASAEINPEAAKVTDSGKNTMYVAFKGKAASADQPIYAVFSNGSDEVAAGTITLTANSKGGRMYFSFDNTDQVGQTKLAAGVYTVKLYAASSADDSKLLGSKSLTIYEVDYTNGKNVTTGSETVFVTEDDRDAALEDHPAVFKFDNGASMWDKSDVTYNKDTYTYTVKLNAYTYVAPPMPGTDPDNPDNPDNPPVVDPAKQFVDVPDVAANKWYRDALNYVLTTKPGVIEGTDGTHFSPNAKLTRAAFAKILWAIDGRQTPTAANPFTDVKDGDWFYDAVIWANAKGIMLGDAGRCKPEDNITREEMAVMIQRWQNGKAAATASKFTDAKDIHDWAAGAVDWAAEEGYIKGKDDGSFAPLASLTRAEMIVVVARTLGWIG